MLQRQSAAVIVTSRRQTRKVDLKPGEVKLLIVRAPEVV